MPLIKGIHNGIGWHDVYLGANQVAYTEDLQIQDPEKVTLWLKSTNVITTWNNLAMCMYQAWKSYYFWAENGKVYHDTLWEVLDTWAWKDIINIERSESWWNYTLYFSDTEDLWYVDYFDSIGSTDWSTETSYVFPSGSQLAMYTSIKDGSDIVFGAINSYYRVVWRWSYTSLTNPSWTPVWIWKTTNYFNLFTSTWEHYYSNWANSLASALNILKWRYKKAFYEESLQGIITSWSPDNSKLYALTEGKTLLASARLSTPDNKKAFYFGRNDYSYFQGNWMVWNDTVNSINNYIYFVWSNGIISYWAEHPWLKKFWNVMTTKNYNNDTVDDIWFVKSITQTDGTIHLYYSWRVGTTCWVDYIDLNGSTYKDSWVFYSPKYITTDADAGQKYKIQRLKCRSTTDADTSIKIYVSLDGWAFTLVDTLSNTNQKQAHLIHKHYECHEIQRKFELITTDSSKTPEFRSFSFTQERIDG